LAPRLGSGEPGYARDAARDRGADPGAHAPRASPPASLSGGVGSHRGRAPAGGGARGADGTPRTARAGRAGREGAGVVTLYVVRHGIAEEVGPGGDDRLRRLTPRGRMKMRAGAVGLKRLGVTL